MSKEEIENKLEQTEDNEVIINLLYQKVDLLEGEIGQQKTNNQKLIEKLKEDKVKFAKENRDSSLQDYVQEILEFVKRETNIKN